MMITMNDEMRQNASDSKYGDAQKFELIPKKT